MPTYDYVCEACGHKFEELQSMKDDPLRKCPKCKKLKLRRLIGSGIGVIFKGSGFYQTDYRSDSYTAGAKADQDASKSSTEASKSSSDKSTGTSDKTSSGTSDTGKAGSKKANSKD
jgi:putative FmdB family regulatory protein